MAKGEKRQRAIAAAGSEHELRVALRALGEAGIRPNAAALHAASMNVAEPGFSAALDHFFAEYGLEVEPPPGHEPLV
jgi:hypothetical protein